MNREIKFRGSYKSKTGKIYWVYFTLNDITGNCNGEPSIYFNYVKNGIHERWVLLNKLENKTLFLGLKDKDGKEIYEGDIIRLFDFQNECMTVANVFYNEKAASFGFTSKYGWLYFSVDNCKVEEIEIIGNVYETPELIHTGAEVSN